MGGWITNDSEAAKKLRKIDREYEKARQEAIYLPLNEKIDALRIARLTRQQAYQKIVSE